MEELIFISRHEPNNGQIALARSLGYTGINQINITFTSDPIKDLEAANITDKVLAIVAPSNITNKLLNAGYRLIEFVNAPIKREKMVFCCQGAYSFYMREFTPEVEEMALDITRVYPDAEVYFEKLPKRIFGEIQQEFIECPLSVDDQYESSLIPTESR